MSRSRRLVAFALGAILLRGVCLAQSSSANFRLQQSTTNDGGQTSTSANYRLDASIGQESAIGASSYLNDLLQSGFWSFLGSGLAPVILTVVKNGTTPTNPDLAWTGNNPTYQLYRATDCSAVFSTLIGSQSPKAYTDIAPPAAPVVCYNVLATAPGPIPPPRDDSSLNVLGANDVPAR